MPQITPPEFPNLNVRAIGVDLLKSERIRPILERHNTRFIQRVLTPKEQLVLAARASPLNFIAKQYAAKEAISKALGTGIAKGVTFQQLEVLRDENGAPVVELFGEALAVAQRLGAQRALLSLSDEGDLIIAYAVLV